MNEPLIEGLRYVSSGLTLIAFLAIVALSAYRAFLRGALRQLQAAPESERADLIRRNQARWSLRLDGVTDPERIERLALEQLRAEDRRRRDYLVFATVALVVCAAILGYALFREVPPPPTPESLACQRCRAAPMIALGQSVDVNLEVGPSAFASAGENQVEEGFFRLTTSALGELWITARGVNEFDPILAVGTVGADSCTFPVATNDDVYSGNLGVAQVVRRAATPGTYCVAIDSFGSQGRLTLHSELRMDANPCRAGAVAELRVNESLAVELESGPGASFEYCSGNSTAERALVRFDVPRAGEYEISAFSRMDTVMGIYRCGPSGDEYVACNDDDSLAGAAGMGAYEHSRVQSVLSQGQHIIEISRLLSGVGHEQGEVLLFARSTADSPAAMCGSVPELPIDLRTRVTVPPGHGLMRSQRCQRRGYGNEAIRRIRIDTAGAYQFFADTGTDHVDPVIYLQRVCADETTEVDCNDDNSADVHGMHSVDSSSFTTPLAPGEYFLVVDSLEGLGGAIDVWWRRAS